jgi:hypothetical protein
MVRLAGPVGSAALIATLTAGGVAAIAALVNQFSTCIPL